ncbi:MAG: DMT family transporter [Candidatus Margulisiibacteriota bacterium]
MTGILLTIIAFLAYAVMSGFVKACSLAGLSAQEIMFIQNLLALVILLPWILAQTKINLAPKNKFLIIIRSVVGLFTFYFFFLAVKMVPLVNAVLLQNTVPLFIPFLALVFFRKRITLRVLLSVIVGFVGVAMVLNPGHGFLRPGDLIALLAGFLSAVTTIVIGRLEEKGEDVSIVVFYFLLITVIVTGIWALPSWQMPVGTIWLYLALAGVLYAVFQVLFVLALKFASATKISPFIYFVVIFSGLIDWLVWKQTPGLLTVAGSVVVIAAAIFSTFGSDK